MSNFDKLGVALGTVAINAAIIGIVAVGSYIAFKVSGQLMADWKINKGVEKAEAEAKIAEAKKAKAEADVKTEEAEARKAKAETQRLKAEAIIAASKAKGNNTNNP